MAQIIIWPFYVIALASLMMIIKQWKRVNKGLIYAMNAVALLGEFYLVDFRIHTLSSSILTVLIAVNVLMITTSFLIGRHLHIQKDKKR